MTRTTGQSITSTVWMTCLLSRMITTSQISTQNLGAEPAKMLTPTTRKRQMTKMKKLKMSERSAERTISPHRSTSRTQTTNSNLLLLIWVSAHSCARAKFARAPATLERHLRRIERLAVMVMAPRISWMSWPSLLYLLNY